ncbi:DUF262 domain-containing protein [Thalassolituus oleivorans]|uniref:DUF262 domain-containing protein n=1 Tax=Thalassolituus oleivorans TaxID=187493 RepID=UPI00042DDE2C|nr:DUF262 domain-containing protein [Thalassolituus oleivorans]AHK15648.1 hypothetical protein R615_07355 [Thalassolituus oleivorans R6-15]
MAHQINPSVTNPTIADIYEKIDDGKMDLSPDFQRKFVWTQEHQEQFLDTILNGFPFPEIYVCQGKTDTIKLRTSQKVIDGQQRLTTIKNYIEGSFDKPLTMVKKFEELDESQREEFLSYKVVVRDIGKVDETLVREIFRRINLTKFKLSDIEIQNAIYDGQFIQTAKELSNKIDLEVFGVFHDSEFTRMADVHFYLQVMSTIERGGYYHRDNELEKCVAEFNDEYSNHHKVKSMILNAISEIQTLKFNLDSIWFRKSNFFTLTVELCMAENKPSDFKDRLLKFEEHVLSNKNTKDNDFGIYYGYMYAGTNNRIARVTRSNLFRQYILM